MAAEKSPSARLPAIAMQDAVGVALVAAPVAVGALSIARLQTAPLKDAPPLAGRLDDCEVAVGATCEWQVVPGLRSKGVEDLLPSLVASLAAAEDVLCVPKHIHPPSGSAHGNHSPIFLFHKSHSLAAVAIHRVRGASHQRDYDDIVLLALESIDGSH